MPACMRHVHIYEAVDVRMYLCMSVCMSVCLVRLCLCTCACMSCEAACACACSFACVWVPVVCLYVPVRVCIGIYTDYFLLLHRSCKLRSCVFVCYFAFTASCLHLESHLIRSCLRRRIDPLHGFGTADRLSPRPAT